MCDTSVAQWIEYVHDLLDCARFDVSGRLERVKNRLCMTRWRVPRPIFSLYMGMNACLGRTSLAFVAENNHVVLIKFSVL